MNLTDEQRALDDAVARLLTKASSDEEAWEGIHAMGLVDAASSGEASTADLAIVARRCGRHAAVPGVVDAVATV